MLNRVCKRSDRWGLWARPTQDTATPEPPPDGWGTPPTYRWAYAFGSAQYSGFHVLMCDGAVHGIGYTIDGRVHEHLGSRRDGEVITKLPW